MANLNSNLGGAEGFGEGVFTTATLAAGNADDGSVYVDISPVFGESGLSFFGTNYTGLYINSNGLITFDEPNTAISGGNLSQITTPAIAPFWADHNLNNGGEVYWDVDPSSGTVTITWSDVAPYSGTGTNTYQVELKDKGDGDFDVHIVYDQIGWTDGDGTPAVAGITDGGSNVFELTGSGDPDALRNFPDSKFKGGEEDHGNGKFHAHFENGVPDFKDGTVDGGGGNDNFVLSIVDGAGDAITTAADKVLAGGGDDYVDANDGDDTIDGGSGSDTLLGGEGADVIHGDGEEGDSATTGTINITSSNVSDTTSGYTVSARNVVGGSQTTASSDNISNQFGGFGADGAVSDSDSGQNSQLAYDLASGLSEELIIDFDEDIDAASFSFQSLYTSNFGEQAQWALFNDGVQVAQSTFTEDGAGSGNGTIDLVGYGNFDQIVFSSLIQTDGTDGSDYMITEVTYEVPQGSEANNDSIDGGAGTDSIFGGLGADTVLGGTGADTIYGEEGNDSIDGGADADLVLGGEGDDTIAGGAGSDTLSGGDGDDYIDGGEGDDVLKTGLGQDTLVGGEGDDTLMNSAGDDSLVGGVGDDSIVATAGDDTLEGGDGADTMFGGSEDDSIVGGAGDDVIHTQLGDDQAFGGDGADTFHVNGAEGVQFNQSGTDGVASASGLSDFPTDALSFEMQFSSTAAGASPQTFASYAVSGEDDEFRVYELPSGTIEITLGGTVLDTDISAAGLFDGAPHSLAVTWDSATGELKLYTDGTEAFSGTIATGETLTQGGTFTFGQDQDSVGGGYDASESFSGEIHNAKLFNDVRTPAEISSDAADHEADTSNPNLIAGWVPDADTGGLTDLTGNHTMTMSGDTQVVTTLGGNDTIVGGEGGTDADTIDLSTLSGDVTVTYTGDEAGTITDGTNTVTFSEIENLILTDADDSVAGNSSTSAVTIDAGDGADTVGGGQGDDSLSGGSGDDVLAGNAGDDTILAGAGADTITGGAGDDHIDVQGDSDTDVIVFADSDGADTVYGFEIGEDLLDVSGMQDAGGDAVNTHDVTVSDSNGDGTGDAILTFPGGESLTLDNVPASQVSSHEQLAALGIPLPDFIVTGTEGDDTIDGSYTDDPDGDRVDRADNYEGSQDDSIVAGAGNDSVIGGDGNDTISGGEGGDTISGGAGDDYIDGGDGDDFLTTGTGDDTLIGGEGNDTLMNSSGDDSLVGGAGNDSIIATEGNDTLEGGSGDDTLDGGADDDSIVGGTGDDLILTGIGDDEAYGGDDADTFIVEDNFGNDTLEGGEGGTDDDTLDLSALTGPVTVTYTGDEAGTITDGTDTITFSEIENLILTDQADVVDASADGAGVDIDAGAGDDTVTGGSSADTISGGAGNDSIAGGDGADTIKADAGDDVVDGGSGNDSIHGGDGADTLEGGAGNDTLDGDDAPGSGGADSISGGAGDDQIIGDEGDDTLSGGADDDVIYAGDDNDLISGDAGEDTLYGQDGDDTLSGGTGDDELVGGTGNDTFEYDVGDGHDTIADFNSGNTGTLDDGDNTNNDSINLSGYYDHISELYADQADDGVLNQSNTTDTRGQNTDYSDNDQFGADDSLTVSGASADNSSFTSENTGVVCFTSGTAILTPGGEVLIDELRLGDLVCTLDNGPQPIRWIGRREIGAQALLNNPKLRPVLIPKDELGAARPLLVSRQHALLHTRDTLTRAIHLTEVKGNRARVAHGRKQVTYIHLMFDAHQIIFAENVPAESFYPGPMALQMLNSGVREELSLIFPECVQAPNRVALVSAYGETARSLAKPQCAMPKTPIQRASQKVAVD